MSTKKIIQFQSRNLLLYRLIHTRSFRSVYNVLMRVTRNTALRSLAPLRVLPGITLSAWGLSLNRKEDASTEKKVVKDPEIVIAEEADKLYAENKFDELYDYMMQYKNSNNAEILWRLCRAVREKARMTTNNKAKQKELMFEAFEYVKKALTIDDNNFAVHKWYAIMLSKTDEYEGTKVQITNSYKCKEHFMRAVELNPHDATTIHCLGMWCFTLADLSWTQRKLASIIFATPPNPSYEEALEYFLKAEQAEPNFYSMNLVMLGKTYLRLKQNDKAREYLQKAIDYKINNQADQDAHDEAVQLMKQV